MISDLLQILLLLIFVIVCFRYARQEEDNLSLIYAALSATTLMISDIYYLIHSLLLEGTRIPFAANDIADFGAFLLLSATLNTAIGADRKALPSVMAGASVFAAANICLWIGWSGEWLRDILGGLAFGYFLCTVIRSVYLTEAMTRWERAAMWAFSTLLIAAEAASFFEPLGIAMDTTAATILMAAGALLLLARIFPVLLRTERADAALSLCFTGCCWSYVCMYMSADIRYAVFSNLCTLHFLLILLAIRKKVKSA